ncbi:MAG: hypothetical protein U9N73_10255, partial [Candidatus Auribacterota bacterium]|nr:hypothetical protein [Candidatus Auribacterota bacterium]
MKNYEELLEQYHPAMFKLIGLDGKVRKQKELYDKKYNSIYSRLIDDKYDLEKVARDEQSALKNSLEKFEAEIEKKKEQPSQIARTVNRILSFIGIAMTKHGEMEIAPTIYQDQKWVYIDTLADDKMKVIKVYVYSNGNRVNKCTIAALGHTIFNSEVIEIPYSYGISLDQADSICFGSGLKFEGKYYPTVSAATKSFDGK